MRNPCVKSPLLFNACSPSRHVEEEGAEVRRRNFFFIKKEKSLSPFWCDLPNFFILSEIRKETTILLTLPFITTHLRVAARVITLFSLTLSILGAVEEALNSTTGRECANRLFKIQRLPDVDFTARTRPFNSSHKETKRRVHTSQYCCALPFRNAPSLR